MDSPVFDYLTQEWEENRLNALFEYEVQVQKDEYHDFIQADDSDTFDFLNYLNDEDCYLLIY